MGMLDTQPIEIACPHCGSKIKQPLRWFKQDGHACPGCGAGLNVSQFRRKIEEIERELANLLRGRR